MKILWVTNIQVEDNPKNPSADNVYGGWLNSLLKLLVEVYNFEVHVVSPHDSLHLMEFRGKYAKNYLIPNNRTFIHTIFQKKHIANIASEFNPDVVHIHGSEYMHSYVVSEVLSNYKKILSLQGIVNQVRQHFFAGISILKLLKFISIGTVINRTCPFVQWIRLKSRAEFEKKLLGSVEFVVGRTEWDKAYSYSFNSNIKYMVVNEPLRDVFYCQDKWSIDLCHKNTLFMSQASYPLKGLHTVLQAVYLVKKIIPDIKLIISGDNITGHPIKNCYARYLIRVISELELDNNIEFIGNIDQAEMLMRLKNANLFLCASSVENSSNSLCEAQIIGVPFIASYVGGIPSLAPVQVEDVLFQSNDHVMLSQKIVNLLSNDSLQLSVSEKYISIAEKRHCKVTIGRQMLEAYKNTIV